MTNQYINRVNGMPIQDTELRKIVNDNLPYYNETLMFEISGDDYKFLPSNLYFNMSALNIDETKTYIGKNKININEEYTFKFVYNKEANVLMDEVNSIYIYNHKSYDGENFIEDENSAVLTFGITTFIEQTKNDGYFRLYEIDKVELDSNCLPKDVNIPNSLTVGTRIGDIGIYSVAEGEETTASGEYSHAEGDYTTASGNVSHAEGAYTIASGNISHAEGGYTTASGDFSHAEGRDTTASGENSHAEGGSSNSISYVISDFSPSTSNDDILTAWNNKQFSLAKGNGSHVEGKDNLALGDYSHTEGRGTEASGMCSHAEGNWTIASSDYQHVQGKYNIEDTTNTYAHIVGNGTSSSARSNAHTLDWNGNAWFAGKLSQDGTPTEDKDLTTKKYVDDKISSSTAGTIDETDLDTILTDIYGFTDTTE